MYIYDANEAEGDKDASPVYLIQYRTPTKTCNVQRRLMPFSRNNRIKMKERAFLPAFGCTIRGNVKKSQPGFYLPDPEILEYSGNIAEKCRA